MGRSGLFTRLVKRDLTFEQNEKWGLVLSGGGTKGAYEVGAWRAVTELKIPLRGITGTSIGALNAALFLSTELKDIEKIYRTIRLTDVLPVSEDDVDPNKNVFDPGNLLAITKEYLVRRGLDNSPLRNLLKTHLNIDRIYASPLDLGIVTFDVQSREPLRLFKEDIEKDKLVDYLLASANFPIFRTQDLGGKRFMDGGLYDNMPFNPMIERGYTHLIVIDINGLGLTRKVQNPDKICLKMVTCSEDLGGTFEFNRERIIRNMKLGYLDTMKAFHKLFGNHYFFRRPAFNDLLLNFDLETIAGLETAARQFGMERCRIYEAGEFIDMLEERFTEKQQIYNGLTAEKPGRPDIFGLYKMIQSGAGIPALFSVFTEQPVFRNSTLAKAFPEASAAASALIELKNFRRL